jgi:predicted acetyltransferase
MITLQKVTKDERSILSYLLQLYLHDYSEFGGNDLNSQGLYDYPWLESYWQEADRYPFFILHETKIAGFALINRFDFEKRSNPPWCMAEFFILRKYRRKKIGHEAAKMLFDYFPGVWEVVQGIDNLPAQKFWKKVISQYTGDHFNNQIVVGTDETVLMQTFTSPSSLRT